MGAWIEILVYMCDVAQKCVAPFVGAWIEILDVFQNNFYDASLPSWERGLKLLQRLIRQVMGKVAPFVGAWIEMRDAWKMAYTAGVAPFVGAWIEIRLSMSRWEP